MTKRDQRRYHKWCNLFHKLLPSRLQGLVEWDEVKHFFFTNVSPEDAAAKYGEGR